MKAPIFYHQLHMFHQLRNLLPLALMLLAWTAPSIAEEKAGNAPKPEDRPVSIAWSVLVNMRGNWVCTTEPEVAVPALIESGVQYIRAGGAAGPALDAGIPNEDVAPWLRKLQDAGIKIGVVLFLQNKAVSSERFIEKAKVLKDSGYYDWIMLDGMRRVRPELQEIIDALHDMGWEKVMLNTSPWADVPGKKKQTAPLPTGIWSYATMFHSLTREVVPDEDDVLVQADIDFVAKIHQKFPESLAVLKFEIPWQMGRFEQEPREKQEQLLSRWAEGQQKENYVMIYPLFTGSSAGREPRDYNALEAGTWDRQVELMKKHNEIMDRSGIPTP
jgi:hypothetical protein